MSPERLYQHHNRLCWLSIGNHFACCALTFTGACILPNAPAIALALGVAGGWMYKRGQGYIALADKAREQIERLEGEQ